MKTKILDSVCGPRPEDHALVVEFFCFFSRFEYALKRAGYFELPNRTHGTKRSDQLQAIGEKPFVAASDWDKFSNEQRGRFASIDNALFKAACDYLKSEPPKRQKIVDSQLVWFDTPQATGETVERYIIRLVCHVRNNLFHGGKFPSGPTEDSIRNQRLIEASLVILKHAVNLDSALRSAFEEF